MTLPFFDGKSILEIIIERLKSRLNGYPIILATTQNPQDDALEEVANKSQIGIYRGDEKNVLQRMVDAASTFNIDVVIRVCADNPFLDIQSILKLIEAHKKHPFDYVSFDVGNSKPSILSHFGFYAELAKLSALENILQKTEDPFYLEHVTNYLYTHPEEHTISLLKAPSYIYGRNDVRLTVDTKQDFELARLMYGNFAEKAWDLKDLIDYLDSQEQIKSEMQKMIIENTK